jgi:hypothetical protein
VAFSLFFGLSFLFYSFRIVLHNWEEEPFIVNMDLNVNLITIEDLNSIHLQFQSNRSYQRSEKKKNPDMDDYLWNCLSPVMYVVTSNDKINNYLPSFAEVSQVPERVVFNLLLNLGKITLKKLAHVVEFSEVNLNGFHHLLTDDDHRIDDTSSQSSLCGNVHQMFESILSNESIYKRCHLLFKFHDALVFAEGSKAASVSCVSSYAFEIPSVAQIEVYKNISASELSVARLIARYEPSLYLCSLSCFDFVGIRTRCFVQFSQRLWRSLRVFLVRSWLFSGTTLMEIGWE